MDADNCATAMKSVVVDPSTYDWEGDVPLQHPSARTIVYEVHVRGFTRHPSSGVDETKRGTFAGLVEKIPYLQQLGSIHPLSTADISRVPASTASTLPAIPR
jgi:glycogen operon protein